MPTQKTRSEMIALLTQCGGLSYRNMVDFLYSVVFFNEIPAGTASRYIQITDGKPVQIQFGTSTIPIVQEINYEDDNSIGKGTPNAAPNFEFNKNTGVLVIYPSSNKSDFRIY